MDTTEFDQKIAAKEDELRVARAQAADVVEKFASKIAIDAKAWLPETIRRQVEAQSDITLKLGAEKIAELKRDMASMLDGLEAAFKQSLTGHTIWPHRDEHPDPDRRSEWLVNFAVKTPFDKVNPPYKVDEAVQKVILREAGGLLRKYGYAMRRFMQEEKYPDHLRWSDEAFQALAPYASYVIRVAEVAKQLQEARDLKKRALAADIWSKT